MQIKFLTQATADIAVATRTIEKTGAGEAETRRAFSRLMALKVCSGTIALDPCEEAAYDCSPPGPTHA